MNATLPQSLAPAFANLLPAGSVAHGVTSQSLDERYMDALERFDWSFEFSDDSFTYRRGVEALRHLYELQAAVDPRGVVWLTFLSAKGNPHGAPMPRVGVFA